MSADIAMPQLGETVTEGTVTKWFKQLGDKVEEDEVLFEVSTDKVDSEVPSPAAGYLAEILVQEGETVDVGVKLAVISDSPPGGEAETDESERGADEAEAASPDGDGGGQAQATQEDQAEQPEPEPEDDAVDAASKAEQAGAVEGEATKEGAEEAAEPADARAGDGADAGGGARAAGAETARREPPARAARAQPAVGGDGVRLLSPVVRRLITEHGLDPNEIEGTGVGGRITRNDVLAFIDAKGGATATAAPPGPAPEREEEAKEKAPAKTADGGEAPSKDRPAAKEASEGPAPSDRDEVVPFSKIRRRTAEHMRRSIDTSAHTLVVFEVDYDNVDRVRLPVKDRFKAEEGASLTYLPFVGRAVVDAIREFPNVNSSVSDDELIVHRYVNLGIAVDLNFEGLIVPVVHDADGKRLRRLAREIADVASRARSKRLSADDISGGTFTITNAGGYGTFVTAPIINQPQVAILHTDGVRPRPVAVALPGGGYGVAVHPVGNLCLSFDHRGVDGAYAAAFLAKVREVLETRDWSQELA
jgi:pyruvate dehydrogenase E2 component (dihydrolipoamide acetyltransferase)